MKFTDAEIQSGLDRVRWAEGLIRQLPVTHDGRNSWLLNYGTSDEAKAIREKRQVRFNEETRAAATFYQCRRCGAKVESGMKMDGCRDPNCPEN